MTTELFVDDVVVFLALFRAVPSLVARCTRRQGICFGASEAHFDGVQCIFQYWPVVGRLHTLLQHQSNFIIIGSKQQPQVGSVQNEAATQHNGDGKGQSAEMIKIEFYTPTRDDVLIANHADSIDNLNVCTAPRNAKKTM